MNLFRRKEQSSNQAELGEKLNEPKQELNVLDEGEKFREILKQINALDSLNAANAFWEKFAPTVPEDDQTMLLQLTK